MIKGIIYKIESKTGEGKCYVGSTVKTLTNRLSKHKDHYKYWKEHKTNYVRSADIFDLYGINNCHIVLLETFECETKSELRVKEGYYIKMLDTVNKYIAGRTEKEYNEDNREIILLRKKLYDQNHKQERKEYYNKNKERIKNQIKEWISKNKEIKTCNCGGHYQAYEHKKHIKTMKHTKWKNQPE